MAKGREQGVYENREVWLVIGVCKYAGGLSEMAA